MKLYSDQLKPNDLMAIDRQMRAAKVPAGNVLAILQIFCLIWLWKKSSETARELDKKTKPAQLAQGKTILDTLKKSLSGLSIKSQCESVDSYFSAQGFTWVEDAGGGKLDNVRSPEATIINKTGDCDDSTCLVETLIPGAQSWSLQKWSNGWYSSGHVISVIPDSGKYHVFSNFRLVQTDASDLKKIFSKQLSGCDWAVRVDLRDITVKEIVKM